MIKYIAVILGLMLFVGCQPVEELTDENGAEDEKALEDEEIPIQEPPEIPKEGKVNFEAHALTSVMLIDTTADVDFKSSGEFSYKIADDNTISGSGAGDVDVEVSGDIGIADCSGKDNVPVTYTIEGDYDPDANEAEFRFVSAKPANFQIESICPSEFGDLTYTIDVPILINEEGMKLKLEQGASINKKLTHPVPSWETDIQADWTFDMVFPEFDFDVEIEQVFLTIKQGERVGIPVTVKLLHGVSQSVILTTTKWYTADITTSFAVSEIWPTNTNILQIETTCKTPLDQYLFTVRGETKDSFKTSQDAITLTVEENPNCRNLKG